MARNFITSTQKTAVFCIARTRTTHFRNSIIEIATFRALTDNIFKPKCRFEFDSQRFMTSVTNLTKEIPRNWRNYPKVIGNGRSGRFAAICSFAWDTKDSDVVEILDARARLRRQFDAIPGCSERSVGHEPDSNRRFSRLSFHPCSDVLIWIRTKAEWESSGNRRHVGQAGMRRSEIATIAFRIV